MKYVVNESYCLNQMPFDSIYIHISPTLYIGYAWIPQRTFINQKCLTSCNFHASLSSLYYYATQTSKNQLLYQQSTATTTTTTTKWAIAEHLIGQCRICRIPSNLNVNAQTTTTPIFTFAHVLFASDPTRQRQAFQATPTTRKRASLKVSASVNKMKQ